MSTTIELPSVLDISRVTEAKASLLEALDRGGEVVVDGSQVERIDAAGVQLLYAFVRELVRQDRDFCWQTPSEHLTSATACLGMQANLQM